MKSLKIITTLICLSFGIISCGDNLVDQQDTINPILSLGDLEVLVNKGNEETSDYLLQRDWLLDHTIPMDWKTFLTWRKGGASAKEATEWLVVQTHGDGDADSWLFYQTWNVEKYNTLKQEALEKGMKKVLSQTSSNGMKTACESNDYIAVFESVTAQIPYISTATGSYTMEEYSNEKTTFKVRLYSKEDFYEGSPHNSHLFETEWNVFSGENAKDVIW